MSIFRPVSWKENLQGLKGSRAATWARNQRRCERPSRCSVGNAW